MIRIVTCSIVLLFQIVFSQHYDIGYNTHYKQIVEIQLDDKNFKAVDFIIDDNKKVTKIFNLQNTIIEELVFVDDILVSGVEYFTNPKFPFLKTPRSFIMQTIEQEVANYYNIQFTSSLIKYLPKLKKAVFNVRLYNSTKNNNFYILNTGHGSKIYYKE
ncbi:MAG: hypothetical protein CMD26_03530 [Flavobacteriales bacterium]|nr:hypothetical protein [Flavobacteriales bacterium]|tara:strand:- start:2854 stop:3330 length:477 start_codon:yes stop_codon:yes gene_type:complete